MYFLWLFFIYHILNKEMYILFSSNLESSADWSAALVYVSIDSLHQRHTGLLSDKLTIVHIHILHMYM